MKPWGGRSQRRIQEMRRKEEEDDGGKEKRDANKDAVLGQPGGTRRL